MNPFMSDNKKIIVTNIKQISPDTFVLDYIEPHEEIHKPKMAEEVRRISLTTHKQGDMFNSYGKKM